MDRVSIFIDGANLFFAMLDHTDSIKLDYKKLTDKLCGANRKLVRAYYYDAPLKQQDDPSRYKKQQRFFNAIGSLEYFDICLGRFERGRQKGVDVLLAVDMIKYAHNNSYDTAVVVSGDSDLVSAVELVKSMGKHVEIAFFDRCFHLKKVADRMIVFTTDYFTDCLLKSDAGGLSRES